MKNTAGFITIVLLILFAACKEKIETQAGNAITITNGNLSVVFNNHLQSKVASAATKDLSKSFTTASFLSTRTQDFKHFQLASNTEKEINSKYGKGKQWTITGTYKKGGFDIQKNISIKSFEAYPDMLFYEVAYINKGEKYPEVIGWTNHHLKINRNSSDTTFWAFQGSSTTERGDWISPIGGDFYNKNFFGMNQADYGGGIPILDVWRRDGGVAIGHTELVPKEIYTNLETTEDGTQADLRIKYNYLEPITFEQGDTIKTFETFVGVHTCDCFRMQKAFTKYMQQKGLKFVEPEPAAYEPIWCAWGYERGFTLEEITGTLPKVKELGFKWAVLDDGYQITEGDWNVNNKKFPQGDKQMKALVDKIHSYGLKAKLWWAPLAVDYRSDLLKKHPEVLLRNADESPQYITWWDAFYMTPAAPETKKHTEEVLDLFLNKWGFDGLKMDGQHMNACPPDFSNEEREPNEAVEKLPAFFKDIYAYAKTKKEHVVVENCPCGCCMSYYNMPYINQAVSSDPLSSWQIRTKGKVYKALIGKTAYYGDHVELSDDGSDFATSFGIGAVLGSKFTFPKDNPTAEASYLLTPEKEQIMKKWLQLYNKKMLSKEDYLGELYDIGFDRPEAHVIQKGDAFYYAFYAEDFNGEIELRGLAANKTYQVTDYYHDKKYDNLVGSNPALTVKFKNFLLLEVIPNN